MLSVSLFLLAFATSLDSFTVGLTYGLRKLHIPFRAILIIACCSAATLLAAMLAGSFLAGFLPDHLADHIGGGILVILGAWILYQFFRPMKEPAKEKTEKMILKFEIKTLGIVVNILRRPVTADIDKSGSINGVEAFLLGFALSLDAFGAGIGAAILQFPPLPMSLLVAFMSSLFVYIGIKSGHLFANNTWAEKLTFLPGVLLIIIGIWKM
ncbi:sporulation membrane protein YtaF [Bacillus lacus]|uniref:Sporulation membrane protein YtaF n=1 Tax=Metabacillus lacus TaxID=1983721 RepID=A0A7X2LZJ5_9BACI|nr:sporulation membrane protein YtaF [Metabacillus lacus]